MAQFEDNRNLSYPDLPQPEVTNLRTSLTSTISLRSDLDVRRNCACSCQLHTQGTPSLAVPFRPAVGKKQRFNLRFSKSGCRSPIFRPHIAQCRRCFLETLNEYQNLSPNPSPGQRRQKVNQRKILRATLKPDLLLTAMFDVVGRHETPVPFASLLHRRCGAAVRD